MSQGRPRIALIGGTYRALCVLERLLERGDHVVAFIGQEGESERDFCPEILEVCDRASVPARSARKLGEEIVRWLEDRIRPDLAIVVGVNTEVPLAIGGNSRLGLLEVVDFFQSDSCPGVVLQQRGQVISCRELERPDELDEVGDVYLRMVDELVAALEEYLDQLVVSRSVPEVAIPFSPTPLGSEALADVVARPNSGSETVELERELDTYLDADHVFALSSSAQAFTLLARSLELGEGNEVLCPGIVSDSVLEGIRSTGARPVFVDVEPGRLTIDPKRVEMALSPRTRAIVIGHAFGQSAALDQLYGIAERAGLEVVEAAGASLGARFGESRLGRSPCTCVFRMPLGAAHAALVTVPHALAPRFAELADEHRLGDGAASAARRLLETWDDRVAMRRENASAYSAALVRYDAFDIPPTPEDALPVYAGYVLRLTRFSRTLADDMYKLLSESGVETRRLSIPLSERELARLPVAEAAASSGLLLPVEMPLTEAQRDHILDSLFSYAIG